MPIPKDATVVMTVYLRLVSRQKLVHGTVAITAGGTRRDVCLCKEWFEGGEAKREGALRLLRRPEVQYQECSFGGKPVVFVLCAAKQREPLLVGVI